MKINLDWLKSLKKMFEKEYWNKANSVEFFAFVIKALIIIPGLLFSVEIWWFYVFSFFSSLALVWSSTVKTIPTLIWFNILWVFLSVIFIVKYFYGA